MADTILTPGGDMIYQIERIDDLEGKKLPLRFSHREGKGWRFIRRMEGYTVMFVPHRGGRHVTLPSVEKPEVMCKIMWPPLTRDEHKKFCLIGVEITGPA